jgi:hypothetical protein
LSYSQDAIADITCGLRMDRCILVYWFFTDQFLIFFSNLYVL